MTPKQVTWELFLIQKRRNKRKLPLGLSCLTIYMYHISVTSLLPSTNEYFFIYFFQNSYFNHPVFMSRVSSYVSPGWMYRIESMGKPCRYTQLIFLLKVCENPYQVLQVMQFISGTASHTRYAWMCNIGLYNYYHNNQSGFTVTESDQNWLMEAYYTKLIIICVMFLLCCANCKLTNFLLIFFNSKYLYPWFLSHTFQQFTHLYALNAVWGRFSQTLGNINTLYSMQGESEDVQLFLVTEDSIIFLLKPVSGSDTLMAYLLTLCH